MHNHDPLSDYNNNNNYEFYPIFIWKTVTKIKYSFNKGQSFSQ